MFRPVTMATWRREDITSYNAVNQQRSINRSPWVDPILGDPKSQSEEAGCRRWTRDAARDLWVIYDYHPFYTATDAEDTVCVSTVEQDRDYRYTENKIHSNWVFKTIRAWVLKWVVFSYSKLFSTQSEYANWVAYKHSKSVLKTTQWNGS